MVEVDEVVDVVVEVVEVVVEVVLVVVHESTPCGEVALLLYPPPSP